MKLADILQGVDYKFDRSSADTETWDVKGLSCDSREIESGWVFVAHVGKLELGAKYIPDAVRRGAIAVVVEDGAEVETEAAVIRVKDTRRALAVMAANFERHPADSLIMVGITASNGKTSTSFMVDEIIKAAGIESGLLGTVFARTGKRVVPSLLTTPDSTHLQSYLRDMVDSGFKACTMEVSSISIAMNRVYGIDYDVLSFANISREHIDDHGDFETYFGLKASAVKRLSRDAIFVYNEDDERIRALTRETAAGCYGFSVKRPDAFCSLQHLDLSTGRGKFSFLLDGERIEITLNVSGYHNVINALAAATIVRAMLDSPKNRNQGLRIDAKHIKQGLENFRGVERRFECIYDREFKIFDDHFANPGNIDVTFETIHKMSYRTFHLCYGVRGFRGTTVNRENAEAMVKHLERLGVNRIVASSSIDTVTSKDAVTPEEKAVFLDCMNQAGIAVDYYDRLTDAVRRVVDAAEPGDVILLAGCQGMDSGGHIALSALSKRHGDESILEPIRERVCGFLPEQDVPDRE
ncbi:MAG: Mur ligase family protein [Bacillota bacterium]|nr:Mur ligase family protein [Bacillota bacterium]